jgi:hypothetical protein
MGHYSDTYRNCVYLLKKYEGHKVGRCLIKKNTPTNKMKDVPFKDKKDDILAHAKNELQKGATTVSVKDTANLFCCSEKSVRDFFNYKHIPCNKHKIKRLPKATKAIIMELLQSGKTPFEVANILLLHPMTIYHYQHKMNKQNENTDSL